MQLRRCANNDSVENLIQLARTSAVSVHFVPKRLGVWIERLDYETELDARSGLDDDRLVAASEEVRARENTFRVEKRSCHLIALDDACSSS